MGRTRPCRRDPHVFPSDNCLHLRATEALADDAAASREGSLELPQQILPRCLAPFALKPTHPWLTLAAATSVTLTGKGAGRSSGRTRTVSFSTTCHGAEGSLLLVEASSPAVWGKAEAGPLVLSPNPAVT